MTANAAAVFAVLLGAIALWWLGYREALPVALGCMLLLSVAMAWRLFGARRCTLELTTTPGRVHRGDEVEVRSAARPSSGGGGRVHAVALVLGVERDLRIPVTTKDPAMWRVTADRRGVVPSAIVRSEHVGPFWLARHRQHDHPATETIVLPRRYPFAVPALPARAEDHHRPGRVRGGAVPTDLRMYTPGDDVRHIHWAASAGTPDGTLLVRQHMSAYLPAYRVLLDPDTDKQHFEACVDATYSIVLALGTVEANRAEVYTVVRGLLVRHDDPAGVERLLTDVHPCDIHSATVGAGCRAALHRVARRSRAAGITTIAVSAAAAAPSCGATVHVRLGVPERAGRLGPTIVLEAPDAASAARVWSVAVGR